MTRRLKAVYDNGVLRPLEALPLRDQEVVNVVISDGAVADELIDAEFLADCQALADDSVTLDEVRSVLAKIPGSMADQIIHDRADRF